MSQNIDNSLIKYGLVYHRIMYSITIFVAIVLRVAGVYPSTTNVTIFCLVVGAFFVIDVILSLLRYFDTEKMHTFFRFFEVLIYNALMAFITDKSVVFTCLLIMTISLSVEFVLIGSDYDAMTINIRRILLAIPFVVFFVLSYNKMDESIWIVYVLLVLLAVGLANYIVSCFLNDYNSYSSIKNKLSLDLSNIEDNNAKLLEYQKRVKLINEQINFQKFDLAKANKELEQINIEMESQTEIMKYMASTFDVLKCINVITDAVIEVKKSKLCAIYIAEDVYMNKFSSCIIKTDYQSMQRRLKKEIESIYLQTKDVFKESMIFEGIALKQFKFISDANINSLAILPISDNSSIYGVMIVGSDEPDFFERGLNYYESCIVEFNVAINSTKLYLKTQEMARKDGLTGIYNRIYFNELFRSAAKTAKSRKQHLSVALFDIDKFKRVNDTYGHLAGDEVIKALAHISEKYANEYNGFTCRYGGEEFLLVLPGKDDSEALQILENMHNEIKNTIVLFKDVQISMDVCIGLTSYPNICSDTDLLISRADAAMYYGKNNGRGRLVLDNPSIVNED